MEKQWSYLRASLLVLVTIVVFIPLLSAGFVWDDNLFTTEGAHNRENLGLLRIWGSPRTLDYYPVTHSAFWIQWRLWGENPVGYHIVTLLFHVGAVVLIWQVLERLKVPGAWWAAFLFAIHPVAAGSVAWISQLKNTMALFWAAACVFSYLYYEENRMPRWYAVSLLCFLLALFSKASVVMLPIVLLGSVWWCKRRVSWADLKQIMPFVVAAGLLGAVTIVFQYKNAIGAAEHEWVRNDGFLSRLVTAGWAFWFYLFKVLWPADLAMIYPRWEIQPNRLANWLPLLAIVVLFAFSWRFRAHGGRALLFGLGSFAILLLPVLGFFNISFFQYSLVADHFQYLPMIPVIALVVGGASYLGSRAGPKLMPVMLVLALVTAGVSGVLSYRRAQAFQSAESLWTDNVAKYDSHWAPHYCLALTYGMQGRNDQAIDHFKKAIERNQNSYIAYHDLAQTYAKIPKLELALENYEKATQIRPDFAPAYHSQGLTLARLQRPDEALQRYEKALEIEPNRKLTVLNTGILHSKLGRIDQADKCFKKALQLAPRDARFHFFIAGAYFEQRRFEEADKRVHDAMRLDPGLLEAAELANMIKRERQLSENNPDASAAKDAKQSSEASP